MDTVEGGYGTSQMPLAGAVLCCTSISPEQRTELAAIGSQMGATIKLDLTSDVTHLIVGSINSAKYRYVAKAREDVKVLSPEWLEALRTLWMEGDDDVDVAALERQYRLPTFYGLKICLTGFDDPSQRKFIQETVVQNGAEYHGDLTKTVTHLIASTPTGKKYEHAVNWKMKIVSWEWFDQSRQRGMTLDENCYDPRMPADERGKGAWDRKLNRSLTPLGKRTRDAGSSQLVNPHRRKLRRAASSRMGTQSEALWAGITAAGLQADQIAQDDWTEDAVVKQGTLRESIPIDNVAVDHVHPADEPVAQPHRPLYANRNNELFEGRVVFAHGFDVEKTQILQQHLGSHGATVIENLAEIDNFSPDDLMRGFLVVPHDVPIDITLLPDGAEKMSLVTNWWVERCLHGKCLVDPIDNILCRPLGKLCICGFNNLTVNSTAFVGIELLHVTKVIALMGASYDEMLSAKTSVMVCNTRKPNSEKFKFATEKKIPAVYSSWLWECLRTGELQPFDQHLLNAVATHPQKPHQKYERVPTAPLPEDRNKKYQAKKNVAKHQQPRTLNLAPSVDPMPTSSDDPSTIPNPSRHLDQDESFIGGVDGPASIPLQDIHPSVNCPRRQSTSPDSLSKPHNADSTSTSRSNSTLDAPRKPAPAPRTSKLINPADSPHKNTEDSVIQADTPILAPEDSMLAAPSEPVPEEKDHASILASLMAARKVHAAAAAKNDNEDDKRKRRRQLGRATSTRSNASTADDVASHASSAADGAKRNTTTLADDGVDTTAEVGYPAEDRHDAGRRRIYQEYQPSQELGWDSPGAQEAREQMIRAMGGKVEEGGVMVKSIGVVKDLVSEAGAGLSRAGRKRRG